MSMGRFFLQAWWWSRLVNVVARLALLLSRGRFSRRG